ncbi:MAG: GNAT family N-acetyltransferase [Sedimentibacter sp.]|uniref:GNAT family N-acetyltransferase n=1 Tax=Sedimentibacter sp. TaxID=1960295 RepID=UPI003158ED9C
MRLRIMDTDYTNLDFLNLTRMLDDDLSERYGIAQKQYDKLNKADNLNKALVIYENDEPVSCGAYKEYNRDTIELKRIFVRKDKRHQGLSRLLISELEQSAKVKGYKNAILETGIKQLEAINLYKSMGYESTDNFGPYIGNTNSVCFSKSL